jgi:hypothetical protein
MNLKTNLWILTEERPKIDVIHTIVLKSSALKNLDINFDQLFISPDIKKNIFNHFYHVKSFTSSKIENIFIKTVSGESSFVDYVVFLQDQEPVPEQILSNCIYAIEETKTSTDESRNTAMGQRSTKFNFLNYFFNTYQYSYKPVMYFSHSQPAKDNDSVTFVNRMLLHLKCGIEFWGKNLQHLKKFNNLDEFINEKNRIADTNKRKNDTPIYIKIVGNTIEISALLAKPNKNNINYKGEITHDPNMGQVPLFANTLRDLGWQGAISIINHQIKQEKVSNMSGNKFSYLAGYIGYELSGLKFNSQSLIMPKKYWKFDVKSEKVASILAQVILESKGMETIFDNHGGCEKSYFIGLNKNGLKEEIPISKSYSSNGGKIPDLVVKDNKSKKIYMYEGKKIETINAGLKELEGFDKFEIDYLKPHYPNYSYCRGLIINGGKISKLPQVKFQILETSEVIMNEEFL